MPTGRLSLVTFVGLLALLGLARIPSATPRAEPPAVQHGEVRDANCPLEGALVRWKGQARASLTDSLGRFRLPQRELNSARLTAWKLGYFIGGADANREQLVVQLRPLPAKDREEYSWVNPTPDRTAKDNCGNCHGEIHREWATSGHAQSTTNRHFLSLYDGTDWQGKPGTGWSLRDEHPDGVGVCTACHAPTVPHDDPAYFDLSKVQGAAQQGVHCDYCHKIADAGLGTIGLTHGRFGIELLRPAEGQLFFGPLDDVDRGEDTYSPLYERSRYCASCHEGTVFGVPVYSTYSEWLESPARGKGKQCQTCHMQPTGRMTNIAPDRGGIERDPKTLANHLLFAGSQLDMVRRALKVTANFESEKDQRRLIVELRADDVGHRVPTGFIDRHLVLVVEPMDKDCNRIEMLAGPTLPKPAGREVASLSGRLYGRLLKDDEGQGPFPFWRAAGCRIEDTRLTPGHSDRMAFTLPASAQRVRIRLLHRRTWPDQAERKGWPDNELVIVDQFLELP
jgi:hypothetical protein